MLHGLTIPDPAIIVSGKPEEVTEVINKQDEVAELKRIAMKGGMTTLHQDSILKFKMDPTSIKETPRQRAA